MRRKIAWIGVMAAAVLVLEACGNGQETQQPDPQVENLAGKEDDFMGILERME